MSLSSLFGFGPSCDIHINLEEQDKRLRTKKSVNNYNNNNNNNKSSITGSSSEGLLIYSQGEEIRGEVTIIPRNINSSSTSLGLEHMGITVTLLGQVELFFDKGNYYDLFKRTSYSLQSPVCLFFMSCEMYWFVDWLC